MALNRVAIAQVDREEPDKLVTIAVAVMLQTKSSIIQMDLDLSDPSKVKWVDGFEFEKLDRETELYLKKEINNGNQAICSFELDIAETKIFSGTKALTSVYKSLDDLATASVESKALLGFLAKFLTFKYDIGQPIVSDRQYDYVHSLIDPSQSKNTSVVMDSPSALKKRKHPFGVGSLEKANDKDSIFRFIANELKYTRGEPYLSLYTSAKLDGCSVLLTYGADGKLVSAVTRGDKTGYGYDITHHILNGGCAPDRISPNSSKLFGRVTYMRAEMCAPYFTNSKYVKTAENPNGFNNQRSFVAGITGRATSDVEALSLIKCVIIHVYDVLNDVYDNMDLCWQLDASEFYYLGKEMWPVSARGTSKNNYTIGGTPIIEKLDELVKKRPNYHMVAPSGRPMNGRISTPHHAKVVSFTSRIPTDGIVVESLVQPNNILDDDKKELPAPEFSRAYKPEWMVEEKYTTVEDIDITFGHNSKVIFTAVVKPVHIGGVTVSRAKIGSFDFIEKNRLNIGSEVKLVRSGEVIPKILAVTIKSIESFKPDFKYIRKGADIFVQDKDIIESSVRVNRFVRFFKFLGLEGFKEATVASILSVVENVDDKHQVQVTSNVDLIAKILENEDKLRESLGPVRGKKIVSAIRSLSDKEIRLTSLMVASGCFDNTNGGFSEEKAKIVEKFAVSIGEDGEISLIDEISICELATERGISVDQSTQLCAYYKGFLKWFTKLHNVVELNNVIRSFTDTNSDGPLAGVKYLCSGFRTNEGFVAFLANLGATEVMGISQANLLLTRVESSKKVEDARKRGIKVLKVNSTDFMSVAKTMREALGK